MEADCPSRASKLLSAHGDVLFAPPDGTSDWQEEFEWLHLLIFPDMKVALRSYHGRFLSDQLDGSLVWNKENIGSQELWSLHLISGGKIALQGLSGKYLSAKPDGEVGCDREEMGEWEVFDWVSNTDKGQGRGTSDGSQNSSEERSSSSASSASSMSSTACPSQDLNSKFRSRTLGLKHHCEPKTVIFK